MTRQEAKVIAETITVEQIDQMFLNARTGIKNWGKASTVNCGITKGVSWNIFSKIDTKNLKGLGLVNAIHEFGDWLPAELQPIKIEKTKRKPTHQDPIFNDDFDLL